MSNIFLTEFQNSVRTLNRLKFDFGKKIQEIEKIFRDLNREDEFSLSGLETYFKEQSCRERGSVFYKEFLESYERLCEIKKALENGGWTSENNFKDLCLYKFGFDYESSFKKILDLNKVLREYSGEYLQIRSKGSGLGGTIRWETSNIGILGKNPLEIMKGKNESDLSLKYSLKFNFEGNHIESYLGKYLPASFLEGPRLKWIPISEGEEFSYKSIEAQELLTKTKVIGPRGTVFEPILNDEKVDREIFIGNDLFLNKNYWSGVSSLMKEIPDTIQNLYLELGNHLKVLH